MPGNVEVADVNSIELGVKFRSDAAGYITGLRFYKGPNNGGAHVGSLWAADGTLLGRATFTDETASGWQQVSFAAPVAIAADTVYVASYLAPQGFYSGDNDYFATAGVDRGVLHALQDGVSGGNGVYVYTASSAFPTQTFSSTNYWVDVVFDTEVAPVLVPDVVNQTQAAAEAAIVAATLTVGNVTTAQSDTVPAGSVISQNPAGGASVLPGTAVDLVVSLGASPVLVPDVVGLEQAAAESAITGLGLVVGAVTTAQSDTVPAGSVISQDPIGGTQVALGAAVALVVSSGPVQCPCSIWDALAAPVVAEDPDTRSTEVGVKFRSDAAGYITGLRFYKGPNNGGAHVGSLWAADGTLLGRATFTDETASGWQQVSFAAPVAIAADTVYVASYLAPQGRFAGDSNYFANAGVDRGVLHALQDGVSGGNGVYVYTASSAFPTQSTGSANYWVDVVFDTEVAPVLVPDVVNQTQAAAEAAIVAATLTVGNVTTAQSDTVPAGSVISQNPAGGASVLPGTAVDLVVSLGASPVLVPDVVGLEQAAAESAITGLGLVVGAVTTAQSDTVPAGSVISQDPIGGTQVALGAAVALVVSSGPVQCPCSIWDASIVPGNVEVADVNSIELGVKFRSDAAGYITGLRFYKGPNNGGAHVGSLWAADGTLLGRATFTDETASGWQQVSFAAPVAIAADTVYVASYLAPQGSIQVTTIISQRPAWTAVCCMRCRTA